MCPRCHSQQHVFSHQCCAVQLLSTVPAATYRIRSLSVDAGTSITRAFISSRLDYCNGLLQYGVADDHLRRLRAVQNAAAHLIKTTSHHHTRQLVTADRKVPSTLQISAGAAATEKAGARQVVASQLQADI